MVCHPARYLAYNCSHIHSLPDLGFEATPFLLLPLREPTRSDWGAGRWRLPVHFGGSTSLLAQRVVEIRSGGSRML